MTFIADTPTTTAGEAATPSQTVIIGTPDECVAQLQGFIDEFGITDIASSGLPPGVDPDLMGPMVERLAREVVPRLTGPGAVPAD
ncbi:MAG: hypothetical protein R2710_04100 [Acidimicrobiales bacterium]